MSEWIDADGDLYTEESYKKFVNQQMKMHNNRIRGKDETIFDALSSVEADFTKTPYGNEVIAAIRSYQNDGNQ